MFKKEEKVVWYCDYCGKRGKRFIVEVEGKGKEMGLCYACSMRVVMGATSKLTQDQWNEVHALNESIGKRFARARR